MGAGKNQLRFPLTAVNGIVTETLNYFFLPNHHLHQYQYSFFLK
jgi:hypothetical protein